MFDCQIKKIYDLPLNVAHHHVVLVFVLQGTCLVKRFSSMKDFKEGEVFFINQNEVYAIHSEQGCVVEWIEVKTESFNQDERKYRDCLELMDSIGSLDQEKEMAEIYRDCVFLKNLLKLALEKKNEDVFHELVDALLTDYLKLNTHTYMSEEQLDWVLKVRMQVSKTLYKKISLQELSSQLKMKKSNFATQYKMMTSSTLMEWANRERLKRAEEMLLFRDLSHQEIIKECGFSDSKYFYRYFMEEFHMTPLAWKELVTSFSKKNEIDLTMEQSIVYLNHMMEQLSGLKTETELYRLAIALRELNRHNDGNRRMMLEADLLHADNYIEVAHDRIHAWYGFDIIMNEIRKNPMPIDLRIDLSKKRTDEDLDEMFNLLKRSADRLPTKLIKNWRFVIAAENSSQFEKVNSIERRIQNDFNGVECRVVFK